MTNLLTKLIGEFAGEKQIPIDLDEKPDPERKLQEFIRYYVEFHDSLVALEGRLHDVEDISEIVREAIQAAYDYYDADWAGILITDSITKMWSPVMWISKRTGWNNETLFDEYEVFENYPRWVEALRTGKPLIIGDVDQVEDLTEREKCHYQKLHVQGVIGAPFGERPTGFMVIKNPRRYKTNADFAHNGKEDLVLVYSDPSTTDNKGYIYEVWGYENDELTMIDSGRTYVSSYETMEMVFAEFEDQTCIVTGGVDFTQEYAYHEYYMGYSGDEVTVVKERTIQTIDLDGYEVDGQPVSNEEGQAAGGVTEIFGLSPMIENGADIMEENRITREKLSLN